ncbi:MAG: protein kinase domain-containing protein [Alphaproteobacteria bacterium]
MTAETQDASAALDVMDEIVTLERAEPDVLLSELATLMLGLQGDSPYRPRVHRLLGVVQMRLNRDDDAMRELAEAKMLAEAQTPPDNLELARIERETAVIHLHRGEADEAAEALQTSLALAALENDSSEVARVIAAMGRMERDALRFDAVVKLYRGLVSKGAVSMLPPHEAQKVRGDLCEALNRLGRHEEALQQLAALREALPDDDNAERFHARLEEARALAGLGRYDDAEHALEEAETLLPEREDAAERCAFIQAVTELQEARGGVSALESLEQLVANYASESEAAQEVVARRALANTAFGRGHGPRACEALALALRTATRYGLSETAAEIRADLAKQGAAHVEDLASTIDLIGSGEGTERAIRLRQLGEGQTDTWLAADLADGELVSLRTVDLQGADDAQREAAIAAFKTVFVPAARIEDPRFAGILSLRLAPGRALHVTQRYIEGSSLRALYEAGDSPERLLELLAGVADALGVLHAQGLVHRALTPEAVIVTRGHGAEWPALVGLGLPLPAETEGTFEPPATAPYAAPEQLEGQLGDPRADLYALGQMIAEVWGGEVPTRQGLGRIWHRDTQDGMPRTVEELLRGLMAPDPAQRTADLGYVAEALRRQRQEMAGAAAPPADA